MLNRVVAGASSVIVAATAVFLSAPAATAAEGVLDAPTLPIVRTDGGIALPTSYPVQPSLTEYPADVTDASIGRGALPYADIAPALNDLMAESDYVSAQVIGKSEQGRDLYLVTVTAPETAAETAQQATWRDAIKHSPTAASQDAAIDAGYKLPIWFNANIHGNEWEGTDATMNYIDQLVETAAEPEVAELLDSTRLYFTVTANPDGRFNGTRATANGYDPNRDFITNATNTTTALRDITGLIQPTYFVDLHGYTGILQVEPCGPPHGENYEYDLFLPHAYSAALAVEEAVVAANIPGNTYDDGAGNPTTENTGKILIPYRDIRSGWDDWPPIFAPQYVAYQGAITNTVELPLGRVNNNPAQNQFNSAVDTEVAEVVIDSIIDYVVENRDPLLENQMEIFERGITGAEQTPIPADVAPEDLAPGVPTEWTDIWDETDIYNATFPRAYVIPVDGSQRSRSDAEQLVEQLLVNDIEVTRATAPFTAGGTTYAAGTFLVDMHQPLRGLANVLLADGTDISERIDSMYDISAWSLALLWGADVVSVGNTTDPALAVSVEPVTSVHLGGSVGDGPYLALAPNGTAEWQAITALLDADIPLSQLADGTVVLGKDAASRAAAEEAAALFGVDFASSDGLALREESTTSLRSLAVGYTTTDDRDALLKLGFDAPVLVSSALIASGAVDLTTLDVLFLGGNLSFSPAQATGAAALSAFLARGGDIVARGSGGATFGVNNGLAQLTATTSTSGSNGIVRVDTPESSVFGPSAQDTAFIYPATWFSALGEGVTVEQSYAADPFVSGHWAASAGRAQADAAGQASAVSAESAAGARYFLFGTSPTFRNHPVGAFGDIARALYWAGGPGTAVVPPITEDDLTEETKTGVSVPETATAGDTITVTVDASFAGQDLTTTLFSAPVGLGTRTVSAAGTFEVFIPADTTAELHRVAVEDETGVLIGWDDITVLAVEEPGEEPGDGTGDGDGDGDGEPGVSDPDGAGPALPGDDVAVTGANDPLPLVGLAGALLLLGACLVVAKRTRRATE